MIAIHIHTFADTTRLPPWLQIHVWWATGTSQACEREWEQVFFNMTWFARVSFFRRRIFQANAGPDMMMTFAVDWELKAIIYIWGITEPICCFFFRFVNVYIYIYVPEEANELVGENLLSNRGDRCWCLTLSFFHQAFFHQVYIYRCIHICKRARCAR